MNWKWKDSKRVDFYYVIKLSRLKLITYFCHLGSWCRRTSQSERCLLSSVRDLPWQEKKASSYLPMKNTWWSPVPNWKKSMKSLRTKMDFCISSMPRRTSTVEHIRCCRPRPSIRRDWLQLSLKSNQADGLSLWVKIDTDITIEFTKVNFVKRSKIIVKLKLKK